MYVAMMVTECDMTGTKYDEPVLGAWAIARSATGRYCCVMYVGPEWLGDTVTMSLTAAYAEIARRGDGIADF